MRDFIFMAECRSSLFRLQTKFSTKRSHRERAIILRTSAHQPVAAAEALQMGILIIIRCDTFLFCILRLRSPEVLTIRNENSGDGLSMFLTTLSEHARSLGICLCRTHHSIDGIELADMFQAMNPLMHFLLPGIPGIVMRAIDHLTYGRKHDIPLIEHELHQHAILRILIEYHLEIGSHRNYAIHLFHFISRKALRQLQANGSFVYNGILWRKISADEKIITVKAEQDETVMQIAVNLGLPWVLRMDGNPLGIDWRLEKQ
jgi:hypothetical protein